MGLKVVTRSTTFHILRSGKARCKRGTPPSYRRVRVKRAKQAGAGPRNAVHYIVSLNSIAKAAANNQQWPRVWYEEPELGLLCRPEESSHNSDQNSDLAKKLKSLPESWMEERSDGVSDETSRASTPSCCWYEMPFDQRLSCPPERRCWRLICDQPPCCRSKGEQIKCSVCGNCACSKCGRAFRMHYDDEPCRCHPHWSMWL